MALLNHPEAQAIERDAVVTPEAVEGRVGAEDWLL